MNPTHQVISLDLAKRLKALGVRQESYFDWRVSESKLDDSSIPDIKGLVVHEFEELSFENDISRHYRVSAFTVAELGEMLPAYVLLYEGHQKPYLECTKTDKWRCTYNDLNGSMITTGTDVDTEAEARGLMLAYLIENKLMTI